MPIDGHASDFGLETIRDFIKAIFFRVLIFVLFELLLRAPIWFNCNDIPSISVQIDNDLGLRFVFLVHCTIHHSTYVHTNTVFVDAVKVLLPCLQSSAPRCVIMELQSACLLALKKRMHYAHIFGTKMSLAFGVHIIYLVIVRGTSSTGARKILMSLCIPSRCCHCNIFIVAGVRSM